MGMSASQARLLSITSRLTNNEFRAQTITNSKLRLAEKSAEASDAYLEALGSKELMFMNYNDNGESSKISLTPASLYDYAPMKNQYLIQNSSGKYLLSYSDVQNFENTQTLADFLTRYDLVYDSTDALNDQRYAEWEAECEKLKEEYNKKHADWEKIVDNWTGTQNNNELYDKFVSVVGTSNTVDQAPYNETCYYYAIRKGDSACYLHLLNHLMDYDGGIYNDNKIVDKMPNAYITYSTTLGDSFTSAGKSGILGDQILKADKNKRNTFKELSESINNPSIMCDGSDKFTPYYKNPANPTDPDADILEWTDNVHGTKDNLNMIQQAIDEGRVPTKYEQLKSDYKYDTSSGQPKAVLKTLKEKICDLYFLILCSGHVRLRRENIPHFNASDYGLNASEITNDMTDMLINLTEGDLKMKSFSDPPPEPELVLPDPPEPVEGIAILRDQEKSQWYTNLWHAMNGSDTSNTVDPINFDNDIEVIKTIPQDIRADYRFTVENKTKDTLQTNYEMLDINLNNSSEWLEFALEHGAVSLVQAQYYNPDEDSNKTANLRADGFKWNNIVYTSARDIISQDDQQAIALAEITYKNTIKEIENEDKKFDQDLKRLDAEHTALQTEYESIKEVISKNTDRSFKAFS